eukprot:3541111-Amphidinium_carterae.1
MVFGTSTFPGVFQVSSRQWRDMLPKMPFVMHQIVRYQYMRLLYPPIPPYLGLLYASITGCSIHLLQ